MTSYILEAANLTFTYSDGTKALDNVNMRIPEGKKCALIGHNGAGKSTLLLHFNGINKPKSGEILYNGSKLLYDHKSLNELRRNIGIVFQDPDTQLFSSSVFQEISFGPLNMKLHRDEVIKRVNEAMSNTGTIEFKDRPTHFLSFGQKKRVAIAGILAMNPMVMILDEPTAGLDSKYSKAVCNLLDDINKRGTTVVVSTHDVNFAYTWADYIFVMKDGKLIGEGTPPQVFTNGILTEEAEIEIPWIIEVYTTLNDKYKESAITIPKNKQQLHELIQQLPK